MTATAQATKTIRTCQHCGTTFARWPSELGKYCSSACYHETRRNTLTVNRHTLTCEHCLKEYESEKILHHGQPRRFCSATCANRHKRKPRIMFACDYCGKTFASPAYQGPRRFCSIPCRSHAFTKPRPQSSRRPRALNHGERMQIAERDNWVCQICRRRIGRRRKAPDPLALHIDHILPASHGGTNDPANLRATHAKCNQAKNAGIGGNGDQLLAFG